MKLSLRTSGSVKVIPCSRSIIIKGESFIAAQFIPLSITTPPPPSFLFSSCLYSNLFIHRFPVPRLLSTVRGTFHQVTQSFSAKMMYKACPVVFCGPSGVGKSTLVKELRQEFPTAFGFSVSHTTRKPREGEVNGKDYHFVTRDVMEQAIKNGDFVESAEFSGNLYGTR